VARVSSRFIMNSSDRPIVAPPDVSAPPAWPSAGVCAQTGAPWKLLCRWGGCHGGKAVAGSADLDKVAAGTVPDLGDTGTSAGRGEDK
jgi:hypothetical protein